MDKQVEEKNRNKTRVVEKPRRQVELIGVAVIVAVLIVGYVLLVKPEFQLRKELKTQLLVIQDDLNTHNNELAELNGIANSYNQVGSKYRQFVDEFIPDGFDYSSVLVNFSAIAQKNNMQVLSMGYAEGSKKKKKSDDEITMRDSLVPIDIDLGVGGSGGYNNFKSLVRDVENNSRLTEVVSFSFDPLAEEYDIKLRIYYYSSPDVISSEE